METKILEQKEAGFAGKFVKNGDVICFPTETVYGIGVIATNEDSYKELIAIKGRAPDKPISLMADSLDTAMKYLDIDPKRYALINYFYPGEVTFLIKAKQGIQRWIDLGTGVVGLRVPDSKFVKELLESVGEACLVTSANISGQKTLTEFIDVKDVFDGKVAAIVEGKCTSNVASTIVDITKEEPVLIRQGKLEFDKILMKWEELQ